MKVWIWAGVAAGLGVGAYFLFSLSRKGGPSGRVAVEVTGLPQARRIPEGYIMGAVPGPEHGERLKELGVKAVLSLVDIHPALARDLDQAGITRLYAPMGKTFRENHAQAVLALRRFDPSEIYIHCTHGVDRSGNVIAFLLHVRHGWTIPEALYAVVNPTERDVSGLSEVLHRRGYTDIRTVNSPGVGIYSRKYALGRGGGMKAHNDDYKELIDTNIALMQRYGS